MLRCFGVLLIGLCLGCEAPVSVEDSCASVTLGCWHVDVNLDEDEVVYYPWWEIQIATTGELKALIGEKLELHVLQAGDEWSSCDETSLGDSDTSNVEMSGADWTADFMLPPRCTWLNPYSTIDASDLGVSSETGLFVCDGTDDSWHRVEPGDTLVIVATLSCYWYDDGYGA